MSKQLHEGVFFGNFVTTWWQLHSLDGDCVAHWCRHLANACTLSLPAVHWDRTILAKLFFGLVNLSYEVNETFARLWHSLFRPISEMELPNCTWLTILNINQSTHSVILHNINGRSGSKPTQWFMYREQTRWRKLTNVLDANQCRLVFEATSTQATIPYQVIPL